MSKIKQIGGCLRNARLAMAAVVALAAGGAWATNYYWTGNANDGGTWSTPGNWATDAELTTPAAAAPASGDTAIFTTANARVSVSSALTVAAITANESAQIDMIANLNVTTLTVASGKRLCFNDSGETKTYPLVYAKVYSGTAVDAEDATVGSTLALSNVRFSPTTGTDNHKITLDGYVEIVDGTSNGIFGNGSNDYTDVDIPGNLTGAGAVYFRTATNASKGTTIRLSGDNSAFSGTAYLLNNTGADMLGATSSRSQAVNFQSDTAGSALATWNIYGGMNFFNTASSSLTLGALNTFSSLSHAQLNSGSSNTLTIGNADDSACDIGFSRGSNGYQVYLVKNGSGTVTYNGGNHNSKNNGTLTLNAGTFKLTKAGQQVDDITFAGGTLGIGDNVEFDYSSEFVNNAESAVSIDVSGATKNYTLGTQLTATKTSGLVKKGAGRLTLAKVPTYTGVTTVEAGTLVLPSGTTLSGAVTLSGGTLVAPVGTVFGSTVSVTDGTIEIPGDNTWADASAQTLLTFTDTTLFAEKTDEELKAIFKITGLGPRQSYSLDVSTGSLVATITAGTLVWNGADGAKWTDANVWLVGGEATTFGIGDQVVFSDASFTGETTELAVTIPSDVPPATVTIAPAAGHKFVFTGTGKVTGVDIAVTGAGTASLATDVFSGLDIATAGTVEVAAGDEGEVTLGAVSGEGSVSVASGALNLVGALTADMVNSSTVVLSTVNQTVASSITGAGKLVVDGVSLTINSSTTMNGYTGELHAKNSGGLIISRGASGGADHFGTGKITLDNGGYIHAPYNKSTFGITLTFSNEIAIVGDGNWITNDMYHNNNSRIELNGPLTGSGSVVLSSTQDYASKGVVLAGDNSGFTGTATFYTVNIGSGTYGSSQNFTGFRYTKSASADAVWGTTDTAKSIGFDQAGTYELGAFNVPADDTKVVIGRTGITLEVGNKADSTINGQFATTAATLAKVGDDTTLTLGSAFSMVSGSTVAVSEGKFLTAATMFTGVNFTFANGTETDLTLADAESTADVEILRTTGTITLDGQQKVNILNENYETTGGWVLKTGTATVTETVEEVETEVTYNTLVATHISNVAEVTVEETTTGYYLVDDALAAAGANGTVTIIANVGNIYVKPGQTIVVKSGVTTGAISFGDEYTTVTPDASEGDATVTVASVSAKATTYTWAGAANGAWETAANWTFDDGTVASRCPTTGDTVNIGNGSTLTMASTCDLAAFNARGTVSIVKALGAETAGFNLKDAKLSLGVDSGVNDALTLEGLTMQFKNLGLGMTAGSATAAGPSGTLTLKDCATTVTGEMLIVNANYADGTLVVDGGTLALTDASTDQVIGLSTYAEGVGGTGTMIVKGGASVTCTDDAKLCVAGKSSTSSKSNTKGVLEIQSGTVTVKHFYTAEGPTNNDATIIVGDENGSTATLSVITGSTCHMSRTNQSENSNKTTFQFKGKGKVETNCKTEFFGPAELQWVGESDSEADSVQFAANATDQNLLFNTLADVTIGEKVAVTASRNVEVQTSAALTVDGSFAILNNNLNLKGGAVTVNGTLTIASNYEGQGGTLSVGENGAVTVTSYAHIAYSGAYANTVNVAGTMTVGSETRIGARNASAVGTLNILEGGVFNGTKMILSGYKTSSTPASDYNGEGVLNVAGTMTLTGLLEVGWQSTKPPVINIADTGSISAGSLTFHEAPALTFGKTGGFAVSGALTVDSGVTSIPVAFDDEQTTWTSGALLSWGSGTATAGLFDVSDTTVPTGFLYRQGGKAISLIAPYTFTSGTEIPLAEDVNSTATIKPYVNVLSSGGVNPDTRDKVGDVYYVVGTQNSGTSFELYLNNGTAGTYTLSLKTGMDSSTAKATVTVKNASGETIAGGTQFTLANTNWDVTDEHTWTLTDLPVGQFTVLVTCDSSTNGNNYYGNFGHFKLVSVSDCVIVNGDDTIAVSGSTVKLAFNNASGSATLSCESDLTAEGAVTIYATDANGAKTSTDITDAFKVTAGANNTYTVELNGNATVGGVKVASEVDTTVAKPLDLSDGSIGLATKTIPGLWYGLAASDTPDGTYKVQNGEDSVKQADGSSLTLSADLDDAATVKFYRVKTGASKAALDAEKAATP